MFGQVLGLQPEEGHELAQALLNVQAEVVDPVEAQPRMHALVRQNAACQQMRQAKKDQDGCDL